ncbi:MAG: hypothetical protein EP338_12680 [Bacteroidetes bacterium]|nr:MAG: hypothetical protein EP338_12680 [Bacteroidota bacterium]
MRIYFLILSVILLGSCKKKDLEFRMQGKVTDLSFNKGLDGGIIEIRELGSNGAISGNPIVSATLDAGGNYDVTFKRKSVIKYLIHIKKDNYFEVDKEIPFGDLQVNETNTYNFQTTAKSWVKLHFINQAPSSADDQLRFIKQDGKEGCELCCPDTDRFVNGTKDSIFYCINDANTSYSYFFWSENPSDFGEESITTIAFDTVEIVKNW